MRCAKQEAGFARVEASKCSKKDMESFTFATIFVRDDGFSLSRATSVCSQVESAVTAGFEKRNLLGCPKRWGKQHLFLHVNDMFCCFFTLTSMLVLENPPSGRAKEPLVGNHLQVCSPSRDPSCHAIFVSAKNQQNPKKLEVRGAVSVISSTNFFTASPMGVRLKLSKH